MSTFYGIALLPEQRVSDVITAFQQRHAKELHWPTELEYVPHVSLLQGPWERRDLTQQRLTTIADYAPYDPLNRIKGYFMNLNVLSHQWISLRVHPISEPNASDLYNWHMVACDVCNDMTDHEVLKHAQREPGWSDDEWHNYCDWGYPYIELDFKPHVTLGHIAENEDIDLQPLIADWKQVFGFQDCFYFDRLCFYRVGENGQIVEIISELKLN